MRFLRVTSTTMIMPPPALEPAAGTHESSSLGTWEGIQQVGVGLQSSDQLPPPFKAIFTRSASSSRFSFSLLCPRWECGGFRLGYPHWRKTQLQDGSGYTVLHVCLYTPFETTPREECPRVCLLHIGAHRELSKTPHPDANERSKTRYILWVVISYSCFL